MDQATDRQQLAQACFDIFESDRRGARIFEYLSRKYVQGPVDKGGIDAVLQTFIRASQRQVIDDLLRLINEGSPRLDETAGDPIDVSDD